ncbi:MAG TPA: hypothetical protein VGR35_02445 [Tepidisphaeraceae bacterium]|nr:hypothetical protein [Tepidisphaeraceae bacterium]
MLQGLVQVGGSAILIFSWVIWTGMLAWWIWRKRLHPVWAAAVL